MTCSRANFTFYFHLQRELEIRVRILTEDKVQAHTASIYNVPEERKTFYNIHHYQKNTVTAQEQDRL